MTQEKMRTRIDGGLVWTGKAMQPLSLVIENGKIAALVPPDQAQTHPAEQVANFFGQWILPGGIDLHVHISDGSETFFPGSCCAAAGGITTVMDMAPFHACVTPEQFKAKVALAEKECVVDFGLIAGIVVAQEDLNHLAELDKMGAAFFKIFMPADPPITTQILWSAIQIAARTGLRLALHAEETACFQNVSDWGDPLAFPHSRPPVAETSAIAQALEMAHAAGAPIHICHVSSARSCELIAWGKAHGTDVTAETAAHYLIFNEKDFARFGARVKTTPPLRGEQDSGSLWAALADGTLDALACDHYTECFSAALKEPLAIESAPAGIAGLETSLPLIFAEGVSKGKLSLERFVDVTSKQPAHLARISDQKGSLEPGKEADFFVIDPGEEWKVQSQGAFSRISTTPYENWTLNSRITQTWLRGQQVWDGKNILKTAGYGRWISSRSSGQ